MDGEVFWVGPAQAVHVGGPVRHQVGTYNPGGTLCGFRRGWWPTFGVQWKRVGRASERLEFAGDSHCLMRRTDL